MQLFQILAAVLLLVGNFFFVAVEFAVTRARPTMVTELVERGAPGSGSLAHATGHIDAYLSACQLGITVCSIGLGITAEPVVARWLEPLFGGGQFLGLAATAVAFAIAYALVSVLHVVLGELAPKSLAIARTERTGLLLAPPMRVFYLVTKPVVDALNWMGNAVLKPFGIPPASEVGHAPHTESELRTLIDQSEREGILDPEEKTFAEGVFGFGDRRAHEVMVPRPQVAVLTKDQTIEQAARAAVRVAHTRLPLCEPGADLDTAREFVHVQSLLGALTSDGAPGQLADLAAPLARTPEVVLLDELLSDMRGRRKHLVLLVDEYGTAVGIVTIEDILEQIVGDLRDEYDAEQERYVERLADHSLRIDGRAPVDVLRTELDLDLGEHREGTVGGYLTARTGRVPEAGETFDLGRWRLTVEGSQDATISRVHAVPREDAAA